MRITDLMPLQPGDIQASVFNICDRGHKALAFPVKSGSALRLAIARGERLDERCPRCGEFASSLNRWITVIGHVR